MYLQCHFFSQVLNQNTDCDILLPSPNSDEMFQIGHMDYFSRPRRYPVLYLFHGAYGDYSDWQRFTGIERYAQEKHLAVVMPSAANSFYQNMWHGVPYYTYLSEELPKLVETYFPVSRKREERFAAGLSMGGYGAFYLALRAPERFACAASLSGAVDLCALVERMQREKMPAPFPLSDIFSDPQALSGTDADLFSLYQRQKQGGACMPRLFMACGTDDFLYTMNERAVERFRALGAALQFEKAPGRHNWDFWDPFIRRVLDWLPLPEA